MFLSLSRQDFGSRRWTVEPEDEAGLDWIVITSDGWRFTITMNMGEPEEIREFVTPDQFVVVLDLNVNRRRPTGMDESWIHIFTNLVRMDHLRHAILSACRVHPEWPYVAPTDHRA